MRTQTLPRLFRNCFMELAVEKRTKLCRLCCAEIAPGSDRDVGALHHFERELPAAP